MADESDNLVLRLLREIRAGQEAMQARLDSHERRFDSIERGISDFRQQVEAAFETTDERFEELRHVMTHSVGLGTANEVRWRDHNARLKQTDLWRQQTDESIAALSRRVDKLETQRQG